ncbi:MAG TPA: YqaA family protein [Cellvibrio sp.]|nr:YqaA family protein [Cellvibrio sp.]
MPFSSEVLLATLVAQDYSLWGLWLAATLGNCLGAVFNAYLGRQCLRWQDRRWFPFKPDKLGRAQRWFQRFGIYSLLLAWVPLVGDPLTFVAGVMRVKWLPLILLVTLGKGLRYAVVIALMV